MLILTRYIAKHEFKNLIRYFDIEDIIEGGRKVLKNLAVEIKSPLKVESFRFFKVRIGRKAKGRMIVFVVTGNHRVVPILIRLKKDKIFGMNMSLNNPNVVKRLNKNLSKVIMDIENKDYQEFSM